MSDVIKLLPDSVANQIAAGEVIQRPASVIKELVENAVDAGATEIQIILKDAGRTLIQVIDNGGGMSETDARLAFERHSTSKIRKAEDLFDLHTMGFRGEALASIAAISQVELRTCKKGAELGTKLVINASTCESQEPDVCPVGSNFMIKNLFFNVPARRKFLKNNQVELSNIVKEFEKLALVNPNIEFTLIHNDNTMYKLSAGNFKQRIVNLLGRALDLQLIPLSIDTTLVKIEGFICKPENARKRNFMQYLFVNGRYMRHPYFHKAIVTSYDNLIPADTQPNYFLYFTVDPESIDVNIHPTKAEIKFENELPIWQILSAAVKESLGKFSTVPSIDFDTDDAPDIPAFTNDKDFEVPEVELDSSYNPFATPSSAMKSAPSRGGGGMSQRTYASSNVDTNWELLYKNFEKSKQQGIENFVPDSETDGFVNSGLSSSSASQQQSSEMQYQSSLQSESYKCMQLGKKFILTATAGGLTIIDQRRAHIRVLFSNYMKLSSSENVCSQRILFPEVLKLTQSQDLILQELEEDMAKIGFGLAKLSGNDWSINGVPEGIDKLDVKDVILQVIDDVVSGGESIATKVMEHIALSVARSSAIRQGNILSDSEMETLVKDLYATGEPNYTPDGKPIITQLSLDQIAKMF